MWSEGEPQEKVVVAALVDAFRPNRYGMHNMTGNGREWVSDPSGPLAPVERLPVLDPDSSAGNVGFGVAADL